MNERLMQQQKTAATNMTFDQLQQRMENQLQAFSAKNQTLQKKADAENDYQFLKNFNQFRDQMKDELYSLNITLKNLQVKTKNQSQKQKVKKYTTDYDQQQEKFTRSVKKIINISFSQRSLTMTGQQKDQRSGTNRNQNGSMDSENGKIAERNDSEISSSQDEENQKKQIQNLKQNQQWETDLEMDKVLLQEKEEELDKFQKDIEQINKNFVEITNMLGNQDNGINQIIEDVFDTNKNVIKADQEITSADKIQKSSKKKYIIFALIVLIALGIVLTVVFTQM